MGRERDRIQFAQPNIQRSLQVALKVAHKYAKNTQLIRSIQAIEKRKWYVIIGCF